MAQLCLLFFCALSLMASSGTRHTVAAHAASPSSIKEHEPALPGLRSLVPVQGKQKGDAKNRAQAQAPVVREIDVEGLKKLLARDARASRPLLVNFWATWCEPCRAEFPDLIKIAGEYRAKGLDFITVSIDDVAEINTTVPRFLKEMRAFMPAYLLNTLEPEAAIGYVDPAWSGSLPATFLYDAQGKVVFKHLGRIKPDELRDAIKAVVK